LAPGGTLVIVDLAAHDRAEGMARLAHRWPGFDDATITGLLGAAGLVPAVRVAVPGTMQVCLWSARRAPAPAAARLETVR
ncbi:MAG: SAM-dependent methyltransferase, partial [Rhodospirillales bacterium]|nr:SAM-dependent methyltransferase [Rhodospirillales bacterium]